MALDLDEQEQVEELKAFWQKYGKLVISTTVTLLIFYIIFQGWNFYINKKSLEATELYQSMIIINPDNKEEIIKISEKIVEQYSVTPYAGRAAIFSAKANYSLGKKDQAKRKLEWASSHAKEDSVRSIAYIQLAQLLFEEKKFDEALSKVNKVNNPGFKGLANDLAGDIYSAMGKIDDAKKSYTEALKSLGTKNNLGNFTQEKLEALGV
jgi:predicted negative regulator of RcsB-dependent stress response